MDGKPAEFEVDLRIPCPFCGKEVQADADRGEILHALPACAEFLTDGDPLDFMIAMRRRIVN